MFLKFGSSLVMVWDAFTHFHKYPLFIMPLDRQRGRNFVDVVNKSQLSGFYFLHNHSKILILMEDDAPIYSSKESSDWMERHGIKKLLWPANSLDLNPIKNLWKILKDTIQQQVLPQNKEELVNVIQKAWKKVSLEIIEVLFSSMPYHMKAMMKANGGSSRW